MRFVNVVSFVVAAFTCAAPLVAQAQSSAVPLPGSAPSTDVTPAVMRLKQVVALVNSGDAAAIRAYVQANSLNERTGSWDSNLLPIMLEIYRLSHGVDLVRVTTVGMQQIQPQLLGETVGILLNQATREEFALAVQVEPRAPYRITGLPILHPSLVATLVRRPASTAVSEDERLQEIGSYLKRLADADIFSGAVVIVRGTQPVFSHAYGYADREKKIPNTLSTPFLLGSMVKLFTGLAIGQLVEQGKLSYDDPLSKFIPDYPDPESARRIKIKHLLSHTSGLAPGFTRKSYYDALDRLRTVQALVATGDREAPSFEPGTRWAYSNFGFVLLGRVIEIVAGEDYYEYMEKNVFSRAGMESTSFPVLPRNGVATVPMAYPYEVEFNGVRQEYVNKLGVDFRRGGPSCCAVASALDLVKAANALQTGRVVKPETFRLHSSAKLDLGAPNYGYGFAVGMRGANNHPLVGHGGNAFGQCTEFGALKDTPYTIIILSNLTIGTCVSVTEKILRVLAS